MADMGFALHRGTTDIDTDLTVVDGAQFFGRAAGGVIERNSHTPILPGQGAFAVSENSILDCYAAHVMRGTSHSEFPVKWDQAMKLDSRVLLAIRTSYRATVLTDETSVATYDRDDP